jgi:hypothetical protein
VHLLPPIQFVFLVENRRRTGQHRVKSIGLFFHPDDPLSFLCSEREIVPLLCPNVFQRGDEIAHLPSACPNRDPGFENTRTFYQELKGLDCTCIVNGFREA